MLDSFRRQVVFITSVNSVLGYPKIIIVHKFTLYYSFINVLY